MRIVSPPPLVDSIDQTIGNTPLVELGRLIRHLNLRGRLLAKLEYFNPGFSKKDRIALEMIRDAKASGVLRDGQRVVELTSGNTGTGLALVCRTLGHPFIAVMSRGNTMERARMMQALGAEVVLVDQAPGSPPGQVSGADLELVEQRARQLTQERRIPGRSIQSRIQCPGPRAAHRAGTLGAVAGKSRRVCRFCRQRRIVHRDRAISQAAKSRPPRLCGRTCRRAVLAGQAATNPNHKIQGGGYSIKNLPLLDRSLVNDYLQVTDEEAIASARMLAREEGIFGGFSSGANLAAAVAALRRSRGRHDDRFPRLRQRLEIPEHRFVSRVVIARHPELLHEFAI